MARQPTVSRPSTSLNPASLDTTPNVVMAVAIQIARKFFFIDTRKLALFLLSGITILSLVAAFVTFDDSSYWVQKRNFLNQYGVKLGWMWTCLVVGPFIWHTSKVHYRTDKDNWIIDIFRLGVATVLWYCCTTGFHRLLVNTSRCDVNSRLSRTQCSEQKGVWIPGVDISGHCFLILYSLLIMAEESAAFRNWHQMTKKLKEREEGREELNWLTTVVQYSFVAMMVLSAVWLHQLVISSIYYHIWYDKVAGALVAVGCWYLTYRVLYPMGFLQSPASPKTVPRRR